MLREPTTHHAAFAEGPLRFPSCKRRYAAVLRATDRTTVGLDTRRNQNVVDINEDIILSNQGIQNLDKLFLEFSRGLTIAKRATLAQYGETLDCMIPRLSRSSLFLGSVFFLPLRIASGHMRTQKDLAYLLVPNNHRQQETFRACHPNASRRHTKEEGKTN